MDLSIYLIFASVFFKNSCYFLRITSFRTLLSRTDKKLSSNQEDGSVMKAN